MSIQVIEATPLISWTSLDDIYLTSYILQYRRVDQVIFQDIVITSSLSSIALPNLEEGVYIFQISSVLTINNAKYNGPISSPVTVIISGQVSLTTHSFCPLTITEILSCLIPSSTPLLVSQESCTAPLIGLLSLAVIVVILIVILSIFTELLLYCHKRRRNTITK